MKQLILSIALLFVTGLLYAQEKTNSRPPFYQPTPYYPPAVTKQELPYSFKHKLKTNNKVVAKVVDPQYAYNKFLKTKNPYTDISFYLGQYTKFTTGLDSIGTWETLRNGDRIWRLKLTTQSNLITGIGVHSSKMNIPQGGKLFFYSDDKKTVVGPVTEPNQKGTRQFLINSIPGKTIWIEYYEPKAQKGKSTFDIDALLYRFVEFPYGATHRLKKEVPYITPIPEFRELSAKKTSDEERGNGQQIGNSSGYLNLPIDSIGVCETLPNGDRIWRVGIHSRTAFSMQFGAFIKIPKGGYLSFYTPNHLFTGTLTTKTYNPDSVYYYGSIPGNQFIMEYYEPAKSKGVVIFRELEINLTNHFTSSIDSRLNQLDSLNCSPNIGCLCDQYSTTPEWCGTTLDTAKVKQLKQSVMRIRTFFECTDPSDPNCFAAADGSGTMVYGGSKYYFCTGALLNNYNHLPYVLTAHHCVNPSNIYTLGSVLPYTYTNNTPYHARFVFNFEADTCNSYLEPNQESIFILNDSKIVSANETSDFLLLQLNDAVPKEFNPYNVGWDAATQALPQKGIMISHPQGYDKRLALQDDDISLVNDGNQSLYNGVRAYRGSYSDNGNYVFQQPEDTAKGTFFALTPDRGAPLAGSSGSPYFNPQGRVIGDLSGGPTSFENFTPSFPNGNNNKLSSYGRLWYSYNKVPGQFSFSPPININAPESELGEEVSATEREKTLQYWLQDPEYPNADAIMDGVATTDCDLHLRDNDWSGFEEPTYVGVDVDGGGWSEESLADWEDIWASPDIWNSVVPAGEEEVGYVGLDGSTLHEEPDFRDQAGNALDNYIHFKVHNPSFTCTSAPALMQLYWTMASTGEGWPNDWNNHYTGTDTIQYPGCHCLVGDEITTWHDAFGNEIPDPYPVESLGPNVIREYWQYWSPPNFTDPNAPKYVNPVFCTNNNGVRRLDVDVNDGSKFEICLLARLHSFSDPIIGEQADTANTSTTQNVINSNNIVTRNTFLADPTIVGMAPDGGGGGIIQTGHPSIIFIANNNNSIKNLDITLDKISGGSIEALNDLVQIDLIPGDELWQKWQSTGFKGQGIQIIADKLIRVTNMETAKLLDIPFNPKEFEPLKIKITILSYSGKKTPVTALPPDTYRFKISHRSSNPNIEISKPSACLFELKDIQKYAQTPMPAGIELKCYPNPFKDQINIEFLLPTDAPVSLFLYDMQGKLVHTVLDNTTLIAGLNTYTINSNDLPKGMYICRLLANNQAVAKKIVKW